MNCLVLNVAVALVLVTSGHQIVFAGAQETSLAQQAYDAAKALVDESNTVLDFVKRLSLNPTATPFKMCVKSFNFLSVRASMAAQDLQDLSESNDRVSSAVRDLENTTSEAYRCQNLLKDLPRTQHLIPLISSKSESLAKSIENTLNLAKQLLKQSRP